MKKYQRIFLALVLFCLFTPTVIAADFVVQQIEIRGLQGLSRGTVLNYLPLRVGDQLTSAKTTAIIQTLYQTGFFRNVNLSRSGNTLIINVVERPVIGSVKVTGNRAIKPADMDNFLKKIGLVGGNVYNETVVAQLQPSLQQEYRNLGYYNAVVKVSTVPQPRNRVNIYIDIKQGSLATIGAITFVGNRAFSAYTLRKQFVLKNTNILSWIDKKNRFSKEKLAASLENLRSFYMDRGYIRFKINDTQVKLSPDHRKVYINVYLTEGPLYTFSGFDLQGNLILPRERMRQLASIASGSVFSRQVVEKANQNMGLALGDEGYAFARIEPRSSIDDRKKQVFVTFYVFPGPKVYVRRLSFKGNNNTADYVLRRNMQQIEGGLLQTRKVKASVRQLKLLQFFKAVDVKTQPVPGKNNQVDLEYDVTETPAGRASISAGWGTLGPQVGAGINQPNFLGTGRTVGLNATWTRYQSLVSFDYYNPYSTINNVGQGYSLFYQKFTPGKINLTGSYRYDSLGGRYFFNVPVTEDDKVAFGASYRYYDLTVLGCTPDQLAQGCLPPSTQVQAFVAENGTKYDITAIDTAWTHVGQDRGIFPTQGLNQTVSAQYSFPVFKSRALNFYKVGLEDNLFIPLTPGRSFLLQLFGGVAYGAGYGTTEGLPFLFNYYAGGLAPGLVRGFESFTLGPKDSNGQPIGGNFLIHGTANFIFPNFISPDSLRTSIFVDTGNVYQTQSDPSLAKKGVGPLRLSTGFEVQWRSPLGPLSFSIAKALNKQPGDETEFFQFTMGTEF